jgi:hypothetical protein
MCFQEIPEEENFTPRRKVAKILFFLELLFIEIPERLPLIRELFQQRRGGP